MGLLETLLVGLGAALLVALVLGVLLRSMLRSPSRGMEDSETSQAITKEIETLKATKADLEKRLAVQEFKASRLSGVEADLMDLNAKYDAIREEKAGAEAHLAAAREAITGVEGQARDLRVRLTEAERILAIARGSLDSVRAAKADVDETLAARLEALNGAEAIALDLKDRLAASEGDRIELTACLRKLNQDKAASDEALAARTEALGGSQKTVAALTSKLGDQASDLDVARREATELKANMATIQETLEQERKRTDEKITLLMTARAEMSKEFKTLAEDVMSRHGENFSKLNKEQMDGILTPLKEKLGEFERSVQTSHIESVAARATLSEQIRHIAETGAAMGKETKDLTEALRGKSHAQGAWGEMVLGTILERSGLRLDEEYTIQTTFSNEEGKRLRPDVIINLPGDARIVVDAKVSLTAFEAFVNAGSDDERIPHLAAHLVSVRSHITTLGSKEYHLATGSTLDYVLMFVPIEGALAAALHADPTLISFAAERNVTITTPTTLMIALRTVRNFWQVERRNQNAEDIAIRAGKLYDKFVGVMADFKVVGDSMDRTRQSYDLAMGKLSSGRGNVVRQLEQLKLMGARTSKALPVSILEAAEGNILGITSDPEEMVPDDAASSDFLPSEPDVD